MAVRKLANGRYAVEFEQAGKRVFRRCPPGVTKPEAAQYEIELRRAAFRQDRLGEREVVPLAAAVEMWLRETATGKKDTRKPRQNAMLLADLIGDRELAEAPAVAQAAVEKWGDELKTSTINRRLAVLKAACKHAWRRGLSEVNYSSRIPLLREPKGREIFLSKPQIAKLAKASPNEECAAAIMILAYSGLRVSEFLALPKTPSTARTLRVSDGKTGARTVPVVDTIRPYLKVLPFPVTYRRLVGWFWEARKKAKMQHVRIHDLRHTTASLLAAKNVPLNVIAEILGDSLLTARRYAHLLQATKAEAMRRIG